MLIAQADGIELLPDTSETLWGVIAILALVAIIVAIASLIVWARRATVRRQELNARVDHLEAHVREHG